MSKMNDLSLTLNVMTDLGKNMVACGENLLKIVGQLRVHFSGDDPEATPAAMTEEPKALLKPVKAYTKEDVRVLLATKAVNGFREETKELVRKYSNGGSLKDVDPARYADLVAEAEMLHD